MTDDMQEQALKRFFQDRLAPAAAALRERGVTFFETAPDRTRTSYWNRRETGEGYVFQVGDIASELKTLWREHPELEALADDLAAMTRDIADRREESADVSSFIYAMF